MVEDKDLRALLQSFKPVLGEIPGKNDGRPQMPESPPAPLSRPSLFRRRKYPTKNKCSEKAEIIGKLGEIYISFGMRELSLYAAHEGLDKKRART